MPDPLPNSGDLIRPATARRALLAQPPRTGGSATKPAKESFALAILRGIARRWRTAVVLGVVLAGVVGAAAWFLVPPPLPSAAAKLLIPLRVQGGLGEHPDPPLERSTQLELIRSRLILNAAMKKPGMEQVTILKGLDDPLDWLGKKLTAEYLGPEILRVALAHADAEQAKVIVAAVTSAYLEEHKNKSGRDREGRLRRLNEEADKYKQQLRDHRAAIQKLGKDGGAYDNEKQLFVQNLLKGQLADIQRQLLRAENDLRAGKAKEKLLAADGNFEVSPGLLDGYVDADRRVRSSEDLLKQTEEGLERDRKKGAKGVDLPAALKELETKLATRKKEHEELRVRVREEAKTTTLAQTKASRAADLHKVRADNMILDELISVLRTEMETNTKNLSDLRFMGAEVAPLQFEVGLTEKLLGTIRLSAQMLESEQDAPTRVQELEAATVVRVDAEKRKLIVAAGGAGAAFLLALALVGLVESRCRRVESADAVGHLGLRLVGTVPTPKGGPLRWFSNDPAQTVAVLTEAIANTRTMLLHGEGSSAERVLLITSPVSREGKTSLSVQLGVSIALAGHTTLLIDGDLRNPTAHERLDMANGPGMCELLRGEVSLFEVIRETTVPGLHLISGGMWTPKTAQALVTAPLNQLLTAWREQYEFVLLDSSPVLPVTDALLFARHVDGVLLSLMQGVSRMSQATEVCDRLASLGVNVIGAIVNGTPARTYGGSGKYYSAATTLTQAPPTEQA